jgi:hypothetical protein
MHSLATVQSNPDLLADPLGTLRSLIRYVVLLWKNPVNVLPMGNSVADYEFVLFIYRNADPVLSNSDFVFTWVALHLFKVSEIKWILAYEILEDRLLGLALNVFRQFGKLFQKTFFVSRFDRDFWPRALLAGHHRLLHQLALPNRSSQ